MQAVLFAAGDLFVHSRVCLHSSTSTHEPGFTETRWSDQDTAQKHPDSALIVLGDFNKESLSRELPKYRQFYEPVSTLLIGLFWICCHRLCEDVSIPTGTPLTYNNDKHWFTAKLRKLRQAKEDAYRKWDKLLYKQAKYTLEKELRLPKRNYSDKLRIISLPVT